MARHPSLAAISLALACATPAIKSARPPAPDADVPLVDAARAPLEAGFTFAPPDASTADAPAPTGSAPVPSVGPWGGETVDPALPPDAPKKFTGHDGNLATPAIVYPLDGSLHPINLLDITVQWTAGTTTQMIYRLRFENDRGHYDVYAPCMQMNCSYAVPEDAWRAIAGMNRDRDVRFTIAAPGTLGGPDPTSPPRTLHFSAGRVAGGLYYWSTSLQGTYRLQLGQKKATPFITPAGGGCYGCHALSRNGKEIAWTDMSTALGPFREQTLRLAPTDNPSARIGDNSMPASTTALSPDGALVLVSDNSGALTLRDARTGAVMTTVPASTIATGKVAFFPEWSPDGKNVAVTIGKSVAEQTAIGFNLTDADIAVLPFDGKAFGAARVVVAHDKDIDYYPSWSPDGKWIVFSSAPAMGAKGAGQTYHNADARLRLVAAAGGTVYELGRATQGTGNTVSWPKFTPFSQLDGQLLFVTYSSNADYGFVVQGKTTPQLWLAAIDLRRLTAGDPSWAPLWLPFQEPKQNNHLPFWTEELGCTADADCGEGATCKMGNCVPNVIIE